MTEKRNIFDGIQGLMPVMVRDPRPANTLSDGVVILTQPTQVVNPFDATEFANAFMGNVATMTISIPSLRGAPYTASGFLTSVTFNAPIRNGSPIWESLIDPGSIDMTFQPTEALEFVV